MERTQFVKPKSLKNTHHNYCPGCGHGIIHRIIAEIIDELNIREKTIAVAPVGCAVFAYDYWDFDVTEAPHGRPPAVATGIKRVLPDRIVFTYQGDGDLAAIGTAEIIHAANRSENITVIFVNNTVYGMTQGQMAPTTLIGQKTLTTPYGRDANRDGYPLKVCELLSVLDGTKFSARGMVTNPKEIIKTKSLIKKAFFKQIENKGFSIVEVLSMCPSGLHMNPIETKEWVEKELTKFFPLGVFKDV
ncbi:MAG: thiamine pyrophosphate-dependent enzyme [Elusimicrobiota bacterium]|nr:thiamine pyrophosphate-dependent enzyme [Endomicrobiia bacterium]MDW8165623.1 thiamine pyrophosphate-dependent enzyme [Elusimicrobiota bacterium]